MTENTGGSSATPKPTATGGRTGNGDPQPPPSIHNWLSLLGLILGIVGLVAGISFFVFGAITRDLPAYISIILVPFLAMILLGLVLVPLGMWIAARRRARGKPPMPSMFVIDLARPHHRYALLLALLGGTLALMVILTGSIQTYQAMESNAFCGQTCHSVMSPEYTAYQHTSHARVKCVECHVGSGMGDYVLSKFSGLRRLSAFLTQSFQRPIPTPIVDMRPSRETCEECHWKGRFAGYKEKLFSYYASDEENTPNKMRMLLKIGGQNPESLGGIGIHYHMLVANKVEYIARDRQRQEIGWVRLTREDGTVVEYEHEDYALSEEEKTALPIRTMECLDCHNRPAHQFRSPQDAVNLALSQGGIDAALPFIKIQAVKALDGEYETSEAALAGIGEALRSFYEEQHPEIIEQKGQALEQAVNTLRRLYRTNIFPEMGAKWSAYPDNIGHRDWPGCFRCHSEAMVSGAGEPLFTSCNQCHLILAQGDNVDLAEAVDFTKGKDFYHPGYDEFIGEFSSCIDCHTGGADLY